MPAIDHGLSIEKARKVVLITNTRRLAESAIIEGQVVKVGASNPYVVPSTANDQSLGVALNSVSAADLAAYEVDSNRAHIEVDVALGGSIVPVLAGGELTSDNFVISDANGRVVAVTGDGTDEIIGKVLRDAAADGEQTHMLVWYLPAVD